MKKDLSDEQLPAGLEDALRAFRDSAHNWTDHERQSVLRPDPAAMKSPAGFGGRVMRWGAVSALLIVLALIPAYRNSLEEQRRAQAAQDALLLDQVNAQLARSMPRSMESLVELLPETATQGDVK